MDEFNQVTGEAEGLVPKEESSGGVRALDHAKEMGGRYSASCVKLRARGATVGLRSCS